MKLTSRTRSRLIVLALLLVVSTVTACTVSAAGGIIGSIGAVLLAGGLLLGVGSQAGCDDEVGPCLSMSIPDGGVDADIGPCLSQPAPDAGTDADIGPCLDVIPWDAAPPDAEIGPCLSQIAPDASSASLLDTHPPAGTATIDDDNRSAALDRLRDRLPADVVARLDGDRDDLA
jgi:hypothetical protein